MENSVLHISVDIHQIENTLYGASILLKTESGNILSGIPELESNGISTGFTFSNLEKIVQTPPYDEGFDFYGSDFLGKAAAFDEESTSFTVKLNGVTYENVKTQYPYPPPPDETSDAFGVTSE